MRYITVFMALIFFLLFTYTSDYIAFADDDFEEHDENYGWGNDDNKFGDERYEELGEMIGWGTVITMGAAGLIFPMRRLTKRVITTVPSFKQMYISMTKFLGKYHIVIGIAAVILSLSHGILMYMSEGGLEFEGITGLGAVILLLMAGSVGAILFKNKKVKILRTTHTILIAFSIVAGLFHILIS